MVDIYIDNGTDIELINDIKEAKRKTIVNGEISVQLTVLNTERNEHAYNLIDNENIIEIENEKYIIKHMKERSLGKRSFKVLQAFHKMFDDLVNNHIYTKLTNTQTLNDCLTFLLAGTGYTFSIIDSFSNVNVGESFGDDNSLLLLNKTLELFQAEFTISGTAFSFYTEIGQDTDFQFRYKYNTKTISKEVKTENLSTYGKGFGKDGLETDYTSPNNTIFGIKHMPPVRDERFTDTTSLQNEIKRRMQDEPIISYEIEEILLGDTTSIGDRVYTIWETLNYDFTARILEKEEDLIDKSKNTVVLANFSNNATDKQSDLEVLKKRFNGVVQDDGVVRYNVLDAAVKKATEDLQSAQTQLEFVNGIIARDVNDNTKLVIFNSEGMGYSLDNGQTFNQGFTHSGLVADAITAGILNSNNVRIEGKSTKFYIDGTTFKAVDLNDSFKYVQITPGNVLIEKGAIQIKREDGFSLIIDGKANFNLNVQGGTPQAIEDDGTVYIEGQYCRTAETTYKRFDYLRFQHTSRYLNLAFYGKSGGAGAYSYVQVQDDAGNIIDTKLTNETTDTNIGMTIDLGVPTGGSKLFYIFIKTTSSGYPCNIRLATKYMTG